MDSKMSRGREKELFPLLRIYKDGTVERLMGTPYVPPSPQDPKSGSLCPCQDPSIFARLYLPKLDQTHLQTLPILVYFHGGGFCIKFAFSSDHHHFLNSLVAQDCWAALQWVTSHIIDDTNVVNKEPWLMNHGDFSQVFLGGDSVGGNIVHNIAMRAGVESLHGGVKLVGAFLTHPYLWGSKPLQLEPIEGHKKAMPYQLWEHIFPGAPDGIDNPKMNPLGPRAPSLARLGCSRLLVSVSEKDELRNRGVWYYNAVKESDWEGEVELVEVEGEGHAFQILKFRCENANNLNKRLVSFLLK
ncbi:hypothetical protein ACB098_02G021300 [Castanea mollissima]